MENHVIELEALVVGTGAAGYNAACRLRQAGIEKVAIVTEGIYDGTSRNTGSDKQTYYKLGLGGDSVDSVSQMARNLFAGGSVDGDNALCEAALSTRCFLNLAELGVPFPVNRYGEYIGYKTDHDPYARATSAGPLTSKFMTQVLQKQAENMENKKLQEQAANAADALKDAQKKQSQGDYKGAEKDLEKAREALGKEQKQDRSGKEQQNPEKSSDNKSDNQAGAAQAAEQEKNKMDPKQADALLDSMSQDEKNLRDAIRSNRNMRQMRPVEKDW